MPRDGRSAPIAHQLHIYRGVVWRVLPQAGLPRIGRSPPNLGSGSTPGREKGRAADLFITDQSHFSGPFRVMSDRVRFRGSVPADASVYAVAMSGETEAACTGEVAIFPQGNALETIDQLGLAESSWVSEGGNRRTQGAIK